MSSGLVLALFAIIIAGYGILNQVQKASLGIFLPWKIFISAIVIIFSLSLIPYFAVSYGWNISLQDRNILESWIFIISIGVWVLSIIKYDQARLYLKKQYKFSNFLEVCLRENLFDEFNRIIQKNQDVIYKLSQDTIQKMFNRRFVRSLFQSGSWIPLQLLTDERLIEKVGYLRHNLIDAVIREILKLEESPLQSVVVRKFGGNESCYISEQEERLIENTFQNPDWYFNINAHYPLVISAVEEIASGRLDEMYNGNGRLYESWQGISPRYRCIIFLSLKTHVMAIENAIEERKEEDFYISDLLDIFRNILKHSRYNKQIWEDKKVNYEHPTPFASLIYEIANDFRNLSEKCVNVAFDRSNNIIEPPGIIAKDLAAIWSFCISMIAQSRGNVGEQFRNTIIEGYLNFILQVAFGASEILGHIGIGSDINLSEWKELYIGQLRKRLYNGDDVSTVLLGIIDNLDIGKQYVRRGRDWIRKEIARN
ncbi:MAG: hypothetical protein KJ771_03900 [Nanoarchaeota archaeon]|nr:hypothetical protein [Nanoarchaeota archaeon]